MKDKKEKEQAIALVLDEYATLWTPQFKHTHAESAYSTFDKFDE